MTDLSVVENKTPNPRIHLGTESSLAFASLSPLAGMQKREEFGPTITDDIIKRICRRLNRLACRTDSSKVLQSILAEPCHFDFLRARPVPNSRLLVFDVGGSRTRVGLRVADRFGKLGWKSILDLANQDLAGKMNGGGKLESLVKGLSSLLAEDPIFKDQEERNLYGTALIWSNKIRNQRFGNYQSDLMGVTSLTDIKNSGSTYGPNEWWGRALKDGLDIGRIFIRGLREAGFNFKTFISGNDTCFVAKAADFEAAAGMVISSGAGTTFRPGGEFLCHSQSGAIRIPVSLDFPEGRGRKAVSIQSLISGSGLPVCLKEWIIYGARQGISALRDLAEAAAAGHIDFQAGDLSLLAKGETKHFHSAEEKLFNSECLDLLHLLSEKLIARAAKLGAALAYFSVANQISDGQKLIVLLDSSQARFLPEYFEIMQDQLSKLAAGTGSSIELRLLSPLEIEKGKEPCQISVPMQGAANVLNDFLVFNRIM